MTTPEPPAVVAGALPAAAACRPLPFPRFAAAASSSPPPPCRCRSSSPPSPPPGAATAAPPVTRSSRAVTLTAMAAPQQGPPPCAGGDAAVVVEVEEDRMDLLWEDFNEELVSRGVGGLHQARGLWSSGSSEPAAASRGCAPVLRPSSRAGGAVRHCRRRAGTWVLLMRIFRRLFVIEKTTVSAKAARRHHAAAATARASC